MDYGYPPSNFERFKVGGEPNYNAQNKEMFSIEYNVDSKEWIFKAVKPFKKLLHKYCSRKSSLQIVPEEDASTRTMGKYKQVINTHLSLSECVSYIELLGIMDLDLESEVKIKNEEGDITGL